MNGFDVAHRASGSEAVDLLCPTTGWMGLGGRSPSRRICCSTRGCGSALRGALATQHVADALAAVGLAEHATKHVYQLKRMRQRAVIARGLLVRTPLLFLDEPTVGILDPVTARGFRAA